MLRPGVQRRMHCDGPSDAHQRRISLTQRIGSVSVPFKVFVLCHDAETQAAHIDESSFSEAGDGIVCRCLGLIFPHP